MDLTYRFNCIVSEQYNMMKHGAMIRGHGPILIMTARERYYAAHLEMFKIEYPAAFSDGHYNEPTYPKVNTANGLTMFVLKFLNNSGWRCTRINSMGRLIDKKEKQQSGVVLNVKGWLPSATRKGSADLSSTIRGRSVMWEVKMKDKPSPDQIKEQTKERRAGGEYFFIHNPDEFFLYYDSL